MKHINLNKLVLLALVASTAIFSTYITEAVAKFEVGPVAPNGKVTISDGTVTLGFPDQKSAEQAADALNAGQEAGKKEEAGKKNKPKNKR
jgi:hypothetical protein